MRPRTCGSLATIFTLAFVSCVATSYHREGSSGGYSETKLSEMSYQVRFQSNGFTRVEVSSALLLRRAAELALENGFRFFVLSDQHSVERGEDPAQIATVKFLETPQSSAMDAIVVIQETNSEANGRISGAAAAALRRLESQ